MALLVQVSWVKVVEQDRVSVVLIGTAGDIDRTNALELEADAKAVVLTVLEITPIAGIVVLVDKGQGALG